MESSSEIERLSIQKGKTSAGKCCHVEHMVYRHDTRNMHTPVGQGGGGVWSSGAAASENTLK